MSAFKHVDAADMAAFRQMLGARSLSGEAAGEDYARDEMTEYGCHAPEAVLKVDTIEEISAVLGYCNDHNIAVVPRGAGTGLCGGCVPIHGGIVLSIERMKRVLEIDAENMVVVAQPGVLLMELAKALESTGLFYPPDPGEKSATIGGNVMTNAGGMRAVRYGVTRDYVLGMRAVLPSGTVLNMGGKVVKTSSGYNLMQLLCGSEGTLCVLGEVTLRLIAQPAVNLSLLAPFEDLAACVEAVPRVLLSGCEPTAVEFMEREVIEAAERYLGRQFPDHQARAYLLIRLDGASEAQLKPSIGTLTELLLDAGALDVLLADTDERKGAIWDARGTFLEAIKGGTTAMDECDVVVPRDRIAEFVRKSAEIGREIGVRLCSFGHAGDGNLHIYACRDDLPEGIWETRRSRVMDELYSAAQALGGQISGEHGVGHAKVDFLRTSVGEVQMRLMADIKRAFDPNGILNPGKVVG